MEETRSEVFLQQKELLEKLNNQMMKMEDFFGYKEKIQALSRELATAKGIQNEQELSKLMGGQETDGLKEKSKKLKRNIPGKLHISKKSKVEVLENNHSSEEEEEEEEDEEADPILTPIKPSKRIKLKREKKMEEEEYKKEIVKLKKKIKSLKLTITSSQEQNEKDFQEKQTEKENLLMELSKEYSTTLKKLFQDDGFLDTINKLSVICENIPKEEREKQSNGHAPRGKVQQSETRETPVDNQIDLTDTQKFEELQKKMDQMAEKQGKLESELLTAREKAQNILERKDAEITKLKELQAEKDKRIKTHLSEDWKKVTVAIKEKEMQIQKIHSLEKSLQLSESNVSRLQRLLAEKEAELESSKSENNSKILSLEESNATLKSERDQAKRLLDEKEAKSEKTLDELTSLKETHEQMKGLIEDFEREDSREAPFSDKGRESSDTSVPEGRNKELVTLKLKIRQLEEEMIEKDKQITDVNTRCFQETEKLKENLEEKHLEIAKLKDSRGQLETRAENHNKSAAETQTEIETDQQVQKFKDELETRKINLRKAKARIRSLEENLKVEKTISINLNKVVTKKSRMLTNIAKKYVRLKKDEQYNADSIQISATIIENLEKKLAERNEAIEQL